MFEIPYYEDYLPPQLALELLKKSSPVDQVEGMRLVGEPRGLESSEALLFLKELYQELTPELKKVLKQRKLDRDFIDQRAKALCLYNQTYGHDYLSSDYETVLGLEDGHGRIVVGPKRSDYVKLGGKPIAELPDFLQGPHVTLFGPPDSVKLSINAMNAFHRRLPNEPQIISELLEKINYRPKWGADDEDSKTPLHEDLISAGVNLSECFNKTIRLDEGNGKTYELQNSHLSLPIKRFPGLALPSTFLFLNESPIPLHLYDFAMHFFAHWNKPEALVFYVPKLENEEEARYIHSMMSTAEKLIKKKHPSYVLGSIRLMIVLENPRAIFRAHEIMDELHPYFAGASLGWHDYLASTARLFKEDSNYRIPVKADPNIVIKYIKASHRLLADVVGPRGGIKVGGMYGVLPQTTDLKSESFQITLKGYFKDVITQMKRNLTGFWVAHPDFVRIGLAVVEAWGQYKNNQKDSLRKMVFELLEDQHAQEVWGFILGPDIEGLDPDDPMYARSLIVADMKESDYMANNHPDEIRYNVFQCLQYLADWLKGNGCVALPAQIDGVAVRVMDDLATTERSRWEVWHEIYHKRFDSNEFLKICYEEFNFIRKDLSNDKKIVQVKWNNETSKWYPIALKLMIKLMTDAKPVEFATELLMSFTIEDVRGSDDPWGLLQKMSPEKFSLDPYVEKFNFYFEALGHKSFAQKLAELPLFDLELAQNIVNSFAIDDVNFAASFHGDIGEGKQTLDSHAVKEQASVLTEKDEVRKKLQSLGIDYKEKFGFKFLVSAAGKSSDELMGLLKERLNSTQSTELQTAKGELLKIALKRIALKKSEFLDVFEKAKLSNASLTLLLPTGDQSFGFNNSKDDYFEVASLSKSVASAFAIEFFKEKSIPLDTKVNTLLRKYGSSYQIPQGDEVQIFHLMNHTALNMHYVFGIPLEHAMPSIESLLNGHDQYKYPAIALAHPAGERFQYSGAGFIVLEYLIEVISKESVKKLTRKFLDSLEMSDFTFEQKSIEGVSYIEARDDSNKALSSPRFMFPSFAAGAMGTSRSLGVFLKHLARAYHDIKGSSAISHETARLMLHGQDLGCRDFMGSLIGLGVFIVEAGPNKFMLHQGANDGFRCIYLYCFAGPDFGKGFVSLSTGELKGVLYHAQVAQTFIKMFVIQGVDYAKFKSDFKFDNLKPEEIVNIGYRDLVFKAFEPTLPEAIVEKGARSPLADLNLAVGAKITRVTNQLFARAENLISPFEPVFDPELFGAQGKIMDSWETVRHNPQHDECELILKKPSTIRYVSFSTKFHTGNHAPEVEVLGFTNNEWKTLVPKTSLEGHSLKMIDRGVDSAIYEQVLVKIYPDGGLTRLGLFSELPEPVKSQKFTDLVPHTKKPLSLSFKIDEKKLSQRLKVKRELYDVASSYFGAKILSASDEHYGPALQVISPYPPLSMFDGLESARSRIKDNVEEVVIELAWPSLIDRIVLDFTYFVNNNPREVCILKSNGNEWDVLVERRNVKAFAGSLMEIDINSKDIIKRIKIQNFPCGGMNRIHIYSKTAAQ
jgi:malate synthase